jgi:oxygen-independent coproporphyrinogen-3 oxidase
MDSGWKIGSEPAEPVGLYIHIPFCQRKCPYCDFNSYAGLEESFHAYTAALREEITRAGAMWGHPTVATIYIGGGTPTVLPVEFLAEILMACRTTFSVAPNAEITCEANPGTVDQRRFKRLRELGISRLSLGIQSLNDAELRFLGRIHDAAGAMAAFEAARAAGFDNINVDLIYGLPGQDPNSWLHTLDQVIALKPEHISLYALTIEEGTPLARWIAEGRFPYPDDDLAADLYELASERLGAAGYRQYEISNWAWHGDVPLPPVANPPLACRHNLIYWRYQPYLGFGAGAHSMIPGRRWWNPRRLDVYLERVASGQLLEEGHEEIDERLGMGEMMMLGLRLIREGVSEERFWRRWGRALDEVFGEELRELCEMGLIERVDGHVRLTYPARLVGNQVFARFLPN